jgi:hypothetical protein
MNLTEVVLLLQNELQKSYDYLRINAAQPNGNDSNLIHLNFNEVEIELPIMIKLKERGVAIDSLKDLPDYLKFMRIPFSLEYQLNQFSASKKEQAEKNVSAQEGNLKIDIESMKVAPGEERKIPDKRFIFGNETNIRLLTGKDIAVRIENQSNLISKIKIKFKPVI